MIPLSYNVRSILRRRFTAGATAVGLGLVVFVFAAVLMLLAGVHATLRSSGSPDNAILVRKGSTSELTSLVTREAAKLFSADPAVAIQGGKPIASPELFVIFQLTRAGVGGPANVAFRGYTQDGWDMLRSQQVKVTEGRVPRIGTSEVMIGKATRGRYEGAELGKEIRIARRNWSVVGVFEAGGSALESEIWTDADQLADAARRPNSFSNLTVRLRSRADLAQLQAAAEADKRFTLEAKREDLFYEEAAGGLAIFVGVMGGFVSFFFAWGAILGAVITMYTQVASRVREVGTLRALGFRRRDVLLSFLVESLILSLLGAVIGVLGATLLGNLSFSTLNFASFTEIKFRFQFTPRIALEAAITATIMGLIGGLPPAIRAARLQIAEAVKG